MKSNLKLFLTVRILTLILTLAVAGMTRPEKTLAQSECQNVKDLMTFDYRNWGIGRHRDCGSCEVYDAPCIIILGACETIRGAEIAMGAPLAEWITLSHAAAISAGVSPIPADIRAKLEHLYPPEILDKVRYKTGSGFLGTLQWFGAEMGGRGAITFDDVIVFKDDDWAGNAEAWAHELEHVRQYDQLSVDGFAQAFVNETCVIPGDLEVGGAGSDACMLEARAYRKQAYWDKRDLVLCCLSQSDAPLSLELRDRAINGPEYFTARDSITIGPNVVLQSGADVTLRAGRIINLSPNFRSERGGRLHTNIDPSLNQTCTIPSFAAKSSQKKSH
jgi:hypothetical protein